LLSLQLVVRGLEPVIISRYSTSTSLNSSTAGSVIGNGLVHAIF